MVKKITVYGATFFFIQMFRFQMGFDIVQMCVFFYFLLNLPIIKCMFFYNLFPYKNV